MVKKKAKDEKPNDPTRRKFVIGAGATAAVAAGAVIGSQVFPREVEKLVHIEPDGSKYYVSRAIYELRYDPKLCIGCRKCMLACSLHHESVCSDYMARLRLDVKPLDIYNEMNVCRQCDYPNCLMACPWEAISFSEVTGAKYVDITACQACGACEAACQYGMIKLINGRGTKCDLCSGSPKCVEVCPDGALTYGLKGEV